MQEELPESGLRQRAFLQNGAQKTASKITKQELGVSGGKGIREQIRNQKMEKMKEKEKKKEKEKEEERRRRERRRKMKVFQVCSPKIHSISS